MFEWRIIELQDVGGGPRATEKKPLKDLQSQSKDLLGLTAGRISYRGNKKSIVLLSNRMSCTWLPFALAEPIRQPNYFDSSFFSGVVTVVHVFWQYGTARNFQRSHKELWKASQKAR